MIKIFKRVSSIVLSAILAFAIVLSINVQVNAATVNYVYAGTVIKNWGVRDQVATFLSPNAEKFYKDNNTTYAKLAALSGSNDVDAIPSTDLYKELQRLMEKNHSHITNYNETRNFYRYTDIQNSGKTSDRISSFYSGIEIGPDWDSGKTWNREHVWPNSKGEGDGENDIMMLRPTSSSENTSRGNAAYGTNGFYDPNKESGGKHDLRGDVARIVLYQYVRWGQMRLFGTMGVIESQEVLIEWMQADPVDTWELGRNDSVETITGTRNVFVDYPELAFILFDEQIPLNYTTPSGNAKGAVNPQPIPENNNQNNNQSNNNNSNNVQSTTQSTTTGNTKCTHSGAYNVEPEEPRCELEGYTVGVYCPKCKKYISGHKVVDPTGHTYQGDCATECDTCGDIREISNDVKHTFGEDSVCTICGVKNNDDSSNSSVQTTGPNEPKSNKVIWWLVGGGVIIVVTAVALLIIFRKKIWPEQEN